MSNKVYRAVHMAQRRGTHVCFLKYRDAYTPIAHLLGDDGLPLDGMAHVYGGKLKSGKKDCDRNQSEHESIESVLYRRLMGHLRKNRKSGRVIYRTVDGPVEMGEVFESRFGYTLVELREHLEARFTPGMTWELLLDLEVQIDNIYPVRIFDLSNSAGIKRAYALSNLQPLWKRDNIAKGRKFDAEMAMLFGDGTC